MSTSRLSARYAKALMDLAQEKGQLEELVADVRQLQDLVAGSAELRMLLRSPVIQPARKRPILEMIFKDRLHPLLWSFIDVLLRKHREMHLVDMGQAFLERYNELNAIRKVTITTAAPVGEDVLRQIAGSLRQEGDQDIDLQTHVDPELIGGYVIQYADRRYDASVARNLRRLRKAFDDNAYVRKF
jgi:F-type H+-transporting ATPase subunit delta